MAYREEVLRVLDLFSRMPNPKGADYNDAISSILYLSMQQEADPVADCVRMICIRALDLLAHGEDWMKVREYLDVIKVLLVRQGKTTVSLPTVSIVLIAAYADGHNQYTVTGSAEYLQTEHAKAEGEFSALRKAADMLETIRLKYGAS